MEPFHQLIQSDQPVLVDFYADWCGPCRSMEPVIKEVAAAAAGRTRIVKVNIDKNNDTARAYDVQAVPTFLLFKKGRVVWRQAGMIDKRSLLEVLGKFEK